MRTEGLDWLRIALAAPAPLFIAKKNGELIGMSQMLFDIVQSEAKLIDHLLAPESRSGGRLAAKAEPFPAPPIKVSVTLPDGRPAIMSLRAVEDSELIVGEIRPSDDEAVSEAEKLEGVIQMARALGHELNQPLTVIMGQAEILLMRLKDDEGAKRRLETIIAEVERMEELTRKLSRIVRYKTQTYADGTPYLDIHKSAE